MGKFMKNITDRIAKAVTLPVRVGVGNSSRCKMHGVEIYV